jgi:hypothetical protein
MSLSERGAGIDGVKKMQKAAVQNDELKERFNLNALSFIHHSAF